MKALVTTGKGGVEIHTVELPTFGDADVLIKVHSVAQNPTDWKTVALRREEGNIIGCDFSGVVVKMGREVPSELRFIGERVAGIVHGGIGKNGAFSQYVSVPAALLFSLPDSWSFEHGAQLGVACFTACQCLYQYLHLPTPLGIPESVPEEFILVWSGATSTGQYVIQFAKLSGLRIITTCSPRNFDLVKSLGAELVFDYADSYTFKHILTATQGRLTMAVDCHCAGTSLMQVPKSFGESGGNLAALLPIKSHIPSVKTEFILAYSIFGLAIEFPFIVEAHQAHYENAIKYAALVTKLISTVPIQTIAMKVYPKGLESVSEGFQYMQDGRVHAEKLTYQIEDTPGL
ncbi:GroES-like protein [Gymnopus androsaceus JB14]|uniref:GroES-like protein n=1 Tax=Gymnopus androsaceus JB14 TaxID=1447944 RepID=A0A6A4GXI5_9AGAR|nr:GroES-like protein [Gymnopus androsaceus JB14]